MLKLLTTIVMFFIVVSQTAWSTTRTDTVNEPPLATTNEWQIAIALGYGQIESAVLGQEDFNLYLVPSVSYYGEKVFFDNGTLGYSLKETAAHSFSLVSEINPHIAQFYGSHPSNIFVINSMGSSESEPSTGASNDSQDDGPPSFIQDVRTHLTLQQPDWSIDAGIQYNWFASNNSQIIGHYFIDVTGVHSGQRAAVSWAYTQPLSGVKAWQKNWSVSFNLGLEWLDKNTTQYYYGVDQRNTQFAYAYHQTDNALNHTVKISIQKALSKQLTLVALWKKQYFDSELANSPLIVNDAPTTYFMGVMYGF